jgi:Tol biopolymer transport system component
MQTIQWYRLLAVGVLAAPIGSNAQGPQPIVKEIATIPGVDMDNALRMPNGQVVVYAADDSIAAYNPTTRRFILIAHGWDDGLAISPQGNRIAYARAGERGDSDFVWSVPIDPRTGAPTGPPQRVSVNPGENPSFSPDGRSIAFARATTKDNLLVVAPATGGAERVLARFDHSIGETSWSTDGKWVFAEIHGDKDSISSIARVPVAGGKVETAMIVPHENSDGSIGGKVAFYRPLKESAWMGVVGYAAAGGVQGEFHLPMFATAGYSFNAARLLMQQSTHPMVLRIFSFADGSLREVSRSDGQTRFVTWSPDGRRLAITEGDATKEEIMVENADGSGARRFAITGGGYTFWGNGAAAWTPDGGSLTYYADSGREVRLLDVTSGTSRPLARFPTTNSVDFPGVWSPTGTLLVTHYAPVATPGAKAHASIVEISRDGTQRTLRDLSTEFPKLKHVYLSANRTALVSVGDSARLQLYRVPIDGGAVHQIPVPAMPESDLFVRWAAVGSSDWFVAPLAKGGSVHAILAVSRSTDSVQIVPVTPGIYHGAPVMVLPDQQHVALVGKTPGDTGLRIFSIPLGGGAVRTIGRVPGSIFQFGGNNALSPDGRTLALITAGVSTTHLFDLDLTPILQSLGQH